MSNHTPHIESASPHGSRVWWFACSCGEIGENQISEESAEADLQRHLWDNF